MREFVREQVGFESQRVRPVDVSGFISSLGLADVSIDLIKHVLLRGVELPASDTFQVGVGYRQ